MVRSWWVRVKVAGFEVLLTFKIGFEFVVKASVELFFFGIEIVKVKTVLSIGKAIVGWGESGFQRAVRRAKGISSLGGKFDLPGSETLTILLAFPSLLDIKRLSGIFREGNGKAVGGLDVFDGDREDTEIGVVLS